MGRQAEARPHGEGPLKGYLGLVGTNWTSLSCLRLITRPGRKKWGPIDHLKMDTEFMEPMLDPADSVLLGSERVKDIEALLAKGDNVVLLSNHRPRRIPCWSFACTRTTSDSRDMIMVAGDRVTSM